MKIPNQKIFIIEHKFASRVSHAGGCHHPPQYYWLVQGFLCRGTATTPSKIKITILFYSYVHCPHFLQNILVGAANEAHIQLGPGGCHSPPGLWSELQCSGNHNPCPPHSGDPGHHTPSWFPVCGRCAEVWIFLSSSPHTGPYTSHRFPSRQQSQNCRLNVV